jgi:hypothetical protein
MPCTFITSRDKAECLERRYDVRGVKERYVINR